MRPKAGGRGGGLEVERVPHNQEAKRVRKGLTIPFKGPCDGQS